MKQSRKNVLRIKAAQKRIQRLHKAELNTMAESILKNRLSVFYDKHGLSQPKNSTGISLRGLNTSQINELGRIVNKFMNDPTTTKTGIQERVRTELQKLQNKKMHDVARQIKKGLYKNKKPQYQKMLDFLDNAEHVKAAAISKGLVPSEQIRLIYNTVNDGDITQAEADTIINELYSLLTTKKGQQMTTDEIRNKVYDDIIEYSSQEDYFGHY